MFLPEFLNHRTRSLNETSGRRGTNQIIADQQTRMTVNVLVTMAVAFSLGMAALLALAGSTLSESIVAGAVATGVSFVNLMRRPPDESRDGQ